MHADGRPPLPDRVVRALRCSVCAAGLDLLERTLRCPSGHTFDLARQGYVNLLHAKIPAGTADTTDMVAARVEFLGAGHYAPLTELVAERAAALTGDHGLTVDAGAGTGHYLAHVLDATGTDGLALDVSAAALRRAARAHPRIGAAVWNLWEPWPVASGVAGLVLNVFAPRNGPEFHRVLAPGGALLVVSPGPGHLAELAGLVDLLEVDGDKQRRLDATLGEGFARTGHAEREFTMTLTPADVRRAIGMGPNAHHLHRGERLARLDEVREPIEVTAAFRVSEYRAVEPGR
ncbi:rRNA (guanine-N1)-methyltransferase [Amycolatopsis antarctica]|uniref:rRNA (Guanine-N1)-methyltransferase n=1 Tax=Amycolatopsis antarctica TaxID=1854586 RepID=A0A263D6N5_9PSEU|nr:rRNA (guanine-N1)-methyltransferase [Amycolatopsis antarctica]OZM74120.1 rRNA (guanine-N1)-methyltransferase [Amycolatopsis antarctica]